MARWRQGLEQHKDKKKGKKENNKYMGLRRQRSKGLFLKSKHAIKVLHTCTQIRQEERGFCSCSSRSRWCQDGLMSSEIRHLYALQDD